MTKDPHSPGKITPGRFYVAMCGMCFVNYRTIAPTLRVVEKYYRHRGWIKSTKYGWICDTCQERTS